MAKIIAVWIGKQIAVFIEQKTTTHSKMPEEVKAEVEAVWANFYVKNRNYFK